LNATETLAQFLVDGWELADFFEHAPMGLH
jgi:hypothetical protein